MQVTVYVRVITYRGDGLWTAANLASSTCWWQTTHSLIRSRRRWAPSTLYRLSIAVDLSCIKGQYISSWEPHPTSTGRHLPYGITQCYLPADTSERAPPDPSHAGWYSIYEGHSKSFATQYDAQMTQAKFLCYYSTSSPLTAMHMLHLSNSSLMPVK